MNENQSVQPVAGAQSEMIVKAADRMARLFVKLFGPYLRTTVLADMVIQAGVKEAEARCRREDPETKPTLSRLIMMTGVTFNRVKEILETPKQLDDHHICTEAAVLAFWSKVHRNPKTGAVMEIPIFGYNGSLQSIVSRIGGRGVSTQTVLERLTKAGNVKVVNTHFARLVSPNWRLIEDNEDEVLDYGTQALSSLGMAVCSGQLIPDSILRLSSAATGEIPPLNA